MTEHARAHTQERTRKSLADTLSQQFKWYRFCTRITKPLNWNHAWISSRKEQQQQHANDAKTKITNEDLKPLDDALPKQYLPLTRTHFKTTTTKLRHIWKQYAIVANSSVNSSNGVCVRVKSLTFVCCLRERHCYTTLRINFKNERNFSFFLLLEWRTEKKEINK